ncbi:ribosome maturation factor RimM [Myxococcota bacterium]|nr:ribosome maturation factor RimM [Myxococcota bacterium]
MLAGHVAGAVGLRGEFRVRLYGDLLDLVSMSRLYLSRAKDGAEVLEHEVEGTTRGRRDDEIRVNLRGVGDRDAAQELNGCSVWLDASQLRPTQPDEYYGFQLMDCRVEDTRGNLIGVVRDIWSTGAADILMVSDMNDRQQLIPTAEEILVEVDVESRRIVIDPIPGLLVEE